MGKTVIAAITGIFVGAFAMEVLNRTKPGLTKGIEDKAKKVADTFAKGFREGWGGNDAAAEPAQPEQTPA
ncbi:hypothetical protein ACFL5Q_02350 [Planctomycetota bacterium]